MPQCDTLKTKRKNKICPEAPRLTALNAVTDDIKGQKSLKYNPSGIPLRKPDSDLSSQGSLCIRRINIRILIHRGINPCRLL